MEIGGYGFRQKGLGFGFRGSKVCGVRVQDEQHKMQFGRRGACMESFRI